MRTEEPMSDLENMIDAVKQGDGERVKAILESDGRLANQRDESGATPLHYAALNGHRQVVQLLVERGADVNSTDSQFGATPAGF
jgi:ankyrin repeat protein